METTKQTTEDKVPSRKKGIVVGDKMDKTIIVEVAQLKTLPKYLKKYKSTKRFKVHDEQNRYKVGDKVEFTECRPISKDKRWKVAE